MAYSPGTVIAPLSADAAGKVLDKGGQTGADDVMAYSPGTVISPLDAGALAPLLDKSAGPSATDTFTMTPVGGIEPLGVSGDDLRWTDERLVELIGEDDGLVPTLDPEITRMFFEQAAARSLSFEPRPDDLEVSDFAGSGRFDLFDAFSAPYVLPMMAAPEDDQIA
jgi:hypothetical protein